MASCMCYWSLSEGVCISYKVLKGVLRICRVIWGQLLKEEGPLKAPEIYRSYKRFMVVPMRDSIGINLEAPVSVLKVLGTSKYPNCGSDF